MLGLNQRKLQKLKTNPKLFFKDAIEKKLLHLNSTYNKYLPKKHKGFTQYTIISAVYNVEKYLDDYFNSIINQRLDFKKNIFMVLVDDGSTDNSANIIKKYQKKYPKNIVYIYKENGGQASARNLGLKYIQENNYKAPWVTFTDPDDFLDRNYFYEVDKFLSTHQDDDICMVGCSVIFYHEKQRIYKDNHPLNFKFKNGEIVYNNFELKNNVHMHAASSVFNIIYLVQEFDEKLKPNFEDAKFVNEYLLENIDLKSAFLPKAKYFYRKREDGTSTLDNSCTKEYFLTTIDIGTLSLLECFYFNRNIQNVCLYHIIWQIKDLINSPEKLSFMSENEKQRYLELLDQNFSYIDTETILDFNLAGCWFFHKVGILNCFKIEKPPFQIAYIEDYDPYKEQILITYYTGDDKDVESIVVDGEEVYIDYKKIVKYDFLDRVFCYQKRLWVSLSKTFNGKLEIYINNIKARITFKRKQLQDIEVKFIFMEMLSNIKISDIWLLMDKDYEADDNAEHLYRYIMQNHPKQKIAFALRKESSDWERLEKEGFNLIEFGSFEFERIIKKASKVISSHCDEYLTKYITNRSQFVFIQHGVILNNLSRWLNFKKINLFITSTQAEYDSIANDYNCYKFGKKEVVLTGLARHDALLKNNRSNVKQILIMPTWRKNIVNSVVANSGKRKLNLDFKQTMYFKKYNSLINNNLLKKVCQEYGYTIVFNPHPNIMPYLKEFNFPSYIKIANQNESLQKLFCNSSLMITDYSSVAFEMAYLEKPVIYYQFDKEEFFTSQWQKGYFDYKKDGFGPVVENEENLLKELESLLQNDCKPFGVYKDNIDSTFVFKDGRCCERIYAMLENMKAD
ncbi:CDP-glycerol:glycerophosphate glycerophosphotransferase [Campylobacter coli]|uniref:CDP-glycerol glycerophosphotransferase family protein n=1 Tax=Campylobacter coli TaxID=195 RepID=UPI001E32A593|nr:CDP-glycerol glycerophosphotransferase family protein [Campylobacter coli]MCE7133136.1 bifunctional glycosyltransferase family 2 protein/CDP-glycerol:glycerophosphate glycerophosphotransferase [Campylobacter coli]MCE7321252.1 bifunctional glycosyltransferase family 2 protein/CDP-glycerol:glycerophosphate glycerophosphotransferase [Campylobacter coli]MDN2930185.1 CDP-glycerol glycerophosphotransferase family protein [Campylobacter coli]MDS1288421.1 CDP-glycerol glycerophosphotransferase famil